MQPETVEAVPQEPAPAKPEPKLNGKAKLVHGPEYERTHFLGVSKVANVQDVPKLRVTIFPRAGDPYPVDVNVQEGGHFRLPDTERSYIIIPHSVWKEEGIYRAVAHEAAGVTVRVRELNRMALPPPEVVDALVETNLVRQYAEEMEETGKWSSLQKWGIGIFMGLALLALGYMAWQIDGGLEGIRGAIDELQGRLATAGSGSSGTGSGHQPIAPGA